MNSPSEETARLNRSAVWYGTNGWKIHPCHGIVNSRCTCGQPHTEPSGRGKHPRLNEWNRKATDDTLVIDEWWKQEPDGNIGVVCNTSGFLVIDIDPRSDGINSFEKFLELTKITLPETVEAITGEYAVGGKILRGRHLFFKCDINEKLIGQLKKIGFNGVDIKHDGYVLIAPSRHFSGVCYEWKEGHAPWEIPMADAPEDLLNILRKRNHTRSGTRLGESDWESIFGDIDLDGERVDIKKMMEEGIDEGSRAIDIYRLTCAVANKFDVTTDLGRMAVENTMIRFNAEKVRPPLPTEGTNGLLHHVRRAIDYVAKNPKVGMQSPETAEWMVEQAKRLAPKTNEQIQPLLGVVYEETNGDAFLPGTFGGTIKQYIEDGDTVLDASSGGNIDIPKDPDAISEADGAQVGKRTLSDTGNGRRLVDNFGQGIRYTPGLGWFTWDGNYWKPDVEDLQMLELSKRLSPMIASEVIHYNDTDKQQEVVKWATQSKSNPKLHAAIENANSDPRILVPVNHWDSNEYLLGVMNGVIDLRTGELLKGRPDLHITKRTPVAYTPGMRNVRWEQFIDFARYFGVQ